MIKGYRNPKADFSIDSDVDQFNFNKNHLHLKMNFDWINPSMLTSIERVNFYLEDGRLLSNIFVVDKSLIYYYEKEWYYDGDIRDDATVPAVNISIRFNFENQDVFCIQSDNEPQPASYDWGYYFSLFKPKRLDSRKSIEKNIFVKVDSGLSFRHLQYYLKLFQKLSDSDSSEKFLCGLCVTMAASCLVKKKETACVTQRR